MVINTNVYFYKQSLSLQKVKLLNKIKIDFTYEKIVNKNSFC